MATKLQQLTAEQETIVSLLDARGVPPTDKGLAHRIEMVLDAKGDVEKDLAFERGLGAIMDQIAEALDDADVDRTAERGPAALVGRVMSLIEMLAMLHRDTEVREDFLHLDGDDAEVFMVRHGTILPVMTRAVIDRVKKLSVPWRSLAESQQSDFIGSVERIIAAQFEKAMRIITAEDHPVVKATLVDFTTKGSTVKIKLETVKTIENLTSLGGVGDRVLDIVFVEQKVLDDASDKGAQPDVDQPPLPLERHAERDAALAKEIPDEDALLAGEDTAPGTAPGWGDDLPHDPDDVIPLASDDDDDDVDQRVAGDIDADVEHDEDETHEATQH